MGTWPLSIAHLCIIELIPIMLRNLLKTDECHGTTSSLQDGLTPQTTGQRSKAVKLAVSGTEMRKRSDLQTSIYMEWRSPTSCSAIIMLVKHFIRSIRRSHNRKTLIPSFSLASPCYPYTVLFFFFFFRYNMAETLPQPGQSDPKFDRTLLQPADARHLEPEAKTQRWLRCRNRCCGKVLLTSERFQADVDKIIQLPLRL